MIQVFFVSVYCIGTHFRIARWGCKDFLAQRKGRLDNPCRSEMDMPSHASPSCLHTRFLGLRRGQPAFLAKHQLKIALSK